MRARIQVPSKRSILTGLLLKIPVAVAQNLETIMLGRFFSGIFGAGPLAVTAGMMADMWGPIDRGGAIGVFGIATFVGPVAGMSPF